ncbi:MAG: dihydroorotase [Chloroflexota bacterium]
MTATEGRCVVRGGRVVGPDGIRAADVVITGERIAAVVAPGAGAAAGGRTIDAAGLLVLPGAIDGHVHFRDPGFPAKEEIATGSAAAVAGGITTAIEMPNTDPPTIDLASARAKAERIAGRSRCDIALLAAVTDATLDAIVPLARSGLVVGFKAFLAPTTGGIPTPSDATLRTAMVRIRDLGMRLAVHAEDGERIALETAALRAAGRTDPLAHLESRPAASEVAAIDRIGRLAVEAGCPVHVLHLSSAPGLAALGRWRAAGARLTAEVTPQHCFLDAAEMPATGATMRVNPPVRHAAEGHAAALLAALADGRIATIGSDHAPHTPEEKAAASIWDAPSGFSGVETLLALFLTHGVAAGRLRPEDLARALGAATADTWGLAPRKGRVAPGADADLTLVDPARPGAIDPARLHGRTNVTPFAGTRTSGAAVLALLRGRVVMEEGEPVGPPSGRLIGPGGEPAPL